ncbi:MAG: aspartate aminotransferase family protein [Pirellula sp.]
MASIVAEKTTNAIHHQAEPQSNDWRDRTAVAEPKSLRTYTPSLAVIARSAGSYHFTPEGRKLADFSSGVLVANLGHNPTRWWKRVIEYMQLGELGTTDSNYIEAAPLTAYNAITPLEIQACERLLANMRVQPGGNRMEQVLWAASGSEAIQKSLWAAMARSPGRNKIIATRGGFHGKKGLAGAVTGSEQDKERDPRVRFISFPKQECISVQRRRQSIDLAPYEAELKKLSEEMGDEISCLITEPYLGGGGSFHPQPEYLQLLERFCRQHDALLILDEIQSNFGRTGPMYAFSHYGLEPDIVCLGKGLGNGIPVAAAVGRRDVFDHLKYGEGSDTWSANPISAAAVLATLDEFENEDILDQGKKLSSHIEAGLMRLSDCPIVAHVRGEGCVWGIEFNPFGNCTAEEVANRCVEACYLGTEDGKAIHLLGPLAGKVIRISPPLTMSVPHAEIYLNAMCDIFAKVAKQC